ncbi:MAG: protein kinase [Steroidobacteraceae bacterium]
MISAYRITALIGHGGAGTVYLGERADDRYSAKVAIKVVESAALHPDLRFRAERQILANLDHANIARLSMLARLRMRTPTSSWSSGRQNGRCLLRPAAVVDRSTSSLVSTTGESRAP